MLIEFVGLPGSGKTTYFNKIKNNDTIGRDSIEKIPLSLKQYYTYTFKNFKLFFYFFIGILYNFELDLKRWYALIIGVHSTWKQFAKIDTLNNKNIILDEGLLQRSLSIFYFHNRKYNPVLFNKVLKIIPQKHPITKIIVFSIDPISSIERCANRKSGLPYRYKKLNKNNLLKKFNYILQGIQKIENQFPNQIEYIINE